MFDSVRTERTPFEDRWNGPYDKLLNYCFGESRDFYVAVKNVSSDVRYSKDIILFMVVFNSKRKPVFIVEVNDDGWVENVELRCRADEQMRRRYLFMLDQCPLPRLWGLCLLGASARFYCGDRISRDLQPSPVRRPDPLGVLPRDFLAGEWAIDITTNEGFAKMKEVIADILANS
jgi:hypothetical protein